MIVYYHRVGPLPSEPHNSVLSRLQTIGYNITDYTTYASGYYPVVRLTLHSNYY